MPALLLLAAGTYFFPLFWPDKKSDSPPSIQMQFTDPLPKETRELFELVRPTVAQIKVMNFAKRSGGVGTGFFISEDGLMLTAYHVVSDAQIFTVKLLDGRMLEAKIQAFDAVNDLALLKVRSRDGFPYLSLASTSPQENEPVLAIGNSKGDYLQPRIGYLLDLNSQAIQLNLPPNTLEMSVPLNQGDSGGPILDTTGQVIGVTSYIRVNMKGDIYSSHAVPVKTTSPMIQALYKGEKRNRPDIGIVIDSTHSHQTKRPGVTIFRVARNSPAARAGLRGCKKNRRNNTVALGDTITNINGQPITNAKTYARFLNQFKVGETITLTYSRDNQKFQTQIKLAASNTIQGIHDEMKKTQCK